MWTRAELKDRAKMCLSRYYWAAFLVSLIFAILSGFGGSNANTQRITSYLEQNESGKQPMTRAVFHPGELEEMEASAEVLGVVLPAGSSLSLDLVMPTDREPEMPDLWLRATCFTVFLRGL